MRKVVYLAFSLLTFYLAGVYRLDVLMFLFFTEILLFAGSCFLPGYFLKNLDLQIRLEEGENGSKKNEPVSGKIIVRNKGRLPVTLFILSLTYRNLKNPEKNQETKLNLKGYVSARDVTEMQFQIVSQYCGILQCSIRELRVYDYFRLFRKKKAVNLQDTQVLLPEGKEIELQGLEEFRNIEDAGDRPSDLWEKRPPDVDDVREYQKGDAMRDIHWKLSARNDELFIKTYREDVIRQASLFLDLRYEGNARLREMDAFFELADSIIRIFVRDKIHLRVWWYDASGKAMVVMQVSEEADIRRAVEELIRNARFYAETGGDDAIQLYESQIQETMSLCLNTKFQLTGRGEVLADFAKDLERRWSSDSLS